MKTLGYAVLALPILLTSVMAYTGAAIRGQLRELFSRLRLGEEVYSVQYRGRVLYRYVLDGRYEFDARNPAEFFVVIRAVPTERSGGKPHFVILGSTGSRTSRGCRTCIYAAEYEAFRKLLR